MSDTIAIALSGGIDSTVAAYLLKQQGHKIIGIHFISGYETDLSKSLSQINQIAKQLEFQIQIIDCTHIFNTKVVDYFVQTYMQGKTPNPCMVCNQSIKFGTILEFAQKLGAKKLATGHYAKITQDKNNSIHLLQGVDPEKDQSYFLARLTQNQLNKACFPLSNLKKDQVIKLASEKNIYPIKKKPSQDICFIKNQTYGEFLIKKCKIVPKPGIIENIDGKIIGQHKGLHLFTIGQRQGINCPDSEPYYVVGIDIKQNRLIVGFKPYLLSSECTAANVNWILQPPCDPVKVNTRIRYRSLAVSSTIFPVTHDKVNIQFESPQLAITPGQGAVFYRNNEVIGSGWIES